MTPTAEKIGLSDGLAFFKELLRLRSYYKSTMSDLQELGSVGSKLVSLPVLFLKSIFMGFETKMSQLVVEAGEDPTRLQSDPSKEYLKEAQDNIIQEFLNSETHKKRIVGDFNKIIDKQTKEFQEAFAGADEKRRSKILAMISDTLDKKFITNKMGLVADWAHYLVIRVPSAAVSAFFVSIDKFGKYIGSQLAVLAKNLFGQNFGPRVAEFAPALLAATLVFKEVTDFLAEFSIKLVTTGLFYPIFAGLTAGFEAEMEKKNPELMTDVKGLVGDKLVDTESDRNFDQIVKDSYAKAREYCEGSLEEQKEKRNKLSLKDFTTSEKLSEFRLKVLAFFDRHEHVKACVVAIKSFTNIIKYAFEATAFNLGKLVAKPMAPFVESLSKSIMKGISALSGKKNILTSAEKTKQDETPGRVPPKG